MNRGALIFILVSYCAISSVIASVYGKVRRPWVPQALRCWKCENEDFDGCLRKGTIQKCQEGVRMACQTEIRYSENRKRPIVRTGCKQDIACSSNKQQNRGAAWSPEQCNARKANSVCRCCCIGSLCNRGSKYLHCKFPSKKLGEQLRDAPSRPAELMEERSCGPQPDAPENGTKTCVGSTGPRSFCRFLCNKGYKLKGSKVSMCARVRGSYVWTRPAPTCLKEEICKNLPATPENGFKSCRGKGEIGSRCYFACNHGYKQYGPTSITCELTEDGAKWSFDPPTCRIGACEKLPDIPENGDYECDGIGEVGTKCEFTCDAGFDLIGHDYTVCKSSGGTNGRWNNPTPECEEVRCPNLPKPPKNGLRECTGDGILGTVCKFACHSGHRLKGPRETACHRDDPTEMAKWDREVPICEPICKTMPAGPEFGYAECTGEGEVGSGCYFYCQPGFDLRGYQTANCELGQSGAEWSHETPTCVPHCKPLRGDPQNGREWCTGDGSVGTLCRYECDEGFKIEGQRESACVRSGNDADWSSLVPTCIPICYLPPELENGRTSCNGYGEVGTKCSFGCESRYRLKGASQMTCEFDSKWAKWSDQIPYCEEYCPPLPEHFEHGSAHCDGTGELGTSCNFTCEGEAYELVGESTISCVNLDGRAIWSHKTPKCDLRPTCPSIGELKHGQVVCNSDLNVDGTVCEFRCLKKGFSLVPDTAKEVVCHRNETWSKRPCCMDCTTVKKDIMIAMDSSGSIKADGWRDMKRFVQNIIKRFRYGPDATLFSVFQFSEAARSDGWMYFNRYKRWRLLNQVGVMNKMGTGTKTGRGLEYAQTRFSRDKGNRKDVPDILLILTDGAAQDPKRMFKVAAELRRQGVEIIALAISPTDDFLEQMSRVTGDRNKVIMAPSIKQLTDDVADMLVSKTCQDESECV